MPLGWTTTRKGETTMKCQFCDGEGIHVVENPPMRLCTSCREKLETHFAVICTGCNTLYWLPKTPQNIMRAAEMSGLDPAHIRDNYIFHEIKSCRRCYEAVQDFTVSKRWVQ